MGDAVSDDVREYYEAHFSGSPNNVVVAHVQFDDGEQIAVFRSMDKANAWADTFENDMRCNGVVFVPYVIDVPEFGNIPVSAQQ
jgi:hypothetical protein